jgi:hypothetical protein
MEFKLIHGGERDWSSTEEGDTGGFPSSHLRRVELLLIRVVQDVEGMALNAVL